MTTPESLSSRCPVGAIATLPASESEVALFGANLHVLVKDEGSAQKVIRAEFDRASVTGYAINKIQPSLEDVFVSSREDYDKAHEGK